MKYLALICALAASVSVAACATKSENDPNVESFKAKGGTVDINCISHGSISVTYKDYIIQIDPVGGRNADYSSFPKADLILITHEHGDHLNKETIEMLTKDDTRLIANGKSQAQLGYGEVMANGQSVTVGKGITVEATPAYNTTEGREQFHPKGNGNGYLLTLGGLRVFVSGDSEDIEEYAQLKDIDVAFLSANQPYTMTVEQCIHAAQVIKPKVLVPYHLSNTDMQAIKDGLEGSGIDVRLHETLR